MDNKIINRRNLYLSQKREEYLKKYYDNNITNERMLKQLNLDMYKQKTTIEDYFEDFLFKSETNDSVTLHPEQLECLNLLNEGEDLLLSAPTSFGKTYLVIEYIYRNKKKLSNILFIVPTLALRNEIYFKLKKLLTPEYNIVINNFDEKKEKNIYLLLPERMEESKFIESLNSLSFDLCIIDEVYKLGKKEGDLRNITFNKAYYSMLDNSKQMILLGPFMNDVSFKRKGKKRKFSIYYSNYSPVFNEIYLVPREKDTNVYKSIIRRISENSGKKQIVFMPSPNKINRFVNELSLDEVKGDKYTQFLSKVYFEEWNLIKLLNNKIAYHSGPLPKYLREYIEDIYNDKNSGYNTIIATSTLLEGVNTPTSVLHINEIKYGGGRSLSKFQLNNLLGRVGRLSEKVKGNIYIYDEKVYGLLEKNYGEDIVFTSEDEEYEKLEEVIEFEKEISDYDNELFKEVNEEIIQQVENIEWPDGVPEVNIDYYTAFKNLKNVLVKKVLTKSNKFQRELAILNFFEKDIKGKNPNDYTFQALSILNNYEPLYKKKDTKDRDKELTNYFKGKDYLDYQLGDLISLLQLENLIDEHYRAEALDLTKKFELYHSNTEVYKTLLDIGFSDFDSELIDEKLQTESYIFVNSQELINDILCLNINNIELSPFAIWKLEKLKRN